MILWTQAVQKLTGFGFHTNFPIHPLSSQVVTLQTNITFSYIQCTNKKDIVNVNQSKNVNQIKLLYT